MTDANSTTIGPYIFNTNGTITGKDGTTATKIDFRRHHYSGKKIKPADAKVIAAALKNNTDLTSIDLSHKEISSEGATAIAQALKVNKTLSSINLSSCQIGHEGAADFAEMLKTNTTIKSIDLTGNYIGTESTKAIAEALKVNEALTSIDLTGNHIGPAGAKVISEALKKNVTLTSINLTYNKIGPEGAADLAEALKVNKTLKSIDLIYNNIGTDGGKSLADAIKENTTLTSIRLSNNLINAEGAAALAEALKVNTTLTTIWLGANQIGPECEAALAEALKGNIFLLDIDGIEDDSIIVSLLRNKDILDRIKSGGALDPKDDTLAGYIASMPDDSFGKDYLTVLVVLCEDEKKLNDSKKKLDKMLRHNVQGLPSDYGRTLSEKLMEIQLVHRKYKSDGAQLDLAALTEILAYRLASKLDENEFDAVIQLNQLMDAISDQPSTSETELSQAADLYDQTVGGWIENINEKVGSKNYADIALLDILRIALTEIATLQLQKDFHHNNVLAGLSGLNIAAEVKQVAIAHHDSAQQQAAADKITTLSCVFGGSLVGAASAVTPVAAFNAGVGELGVTLAATAFGTAGLLVGALIGYGSSYAYIKRKTSSNEVLFAANKHNDHIDSRYTPPANQRLLVKQSTDQDTTPAPGDSNRPS